MTIDNLISIMDGEIKGLELSNDNATLRNEKKCEYRQEVYSFYNSIP